MMNNNSTDQDDVDNNTPREDDGERIEETTSIKRNNLDKKIIYETRDLYTLSNFMKYCLNSQYNVKQRLVEKECGKIVCQFI